MRFAGLLIDLAADPGHLPCRCKPLLGIGAHDGKAHRLAGLDLGNIIFINVDPNPHTGGIGDGEKLGRSLDRLAFDGVPGHNRPVDRGDDVQEVLGVLDRKSVV